jgi:hypothetical protein
MLFAFAMQGGSKEWIELQDERWYKLRIRSRYLPVEVITVVFFGFL